KQSDGVAGGLFCFWVSEVFQLVFGVEVMIFGVLAALAVLFHDAEVRTFHNEGLLAVSWATIGLHILFFSRIVLRLFFLAREFELSVAALGEWRGGGWVGFSFGVWTLLLRKGVWVRNLFSFLFVSKPNREMDDGGQPKFVSIGQHFWDSSVSLVGCDFRFNRNLRVVLEWQ
ncbi:hypothetical protein Ancab_005123, partial [Ancistrocladus abbreviatus]